MWFTMRGVALTDLFEVVQLLIAQFNELLCCVVNGVHVLFSHGGELGRQVTACMEEEITVKCYWRVPLPP